MQRAHIAETRGHQALGDLGGRRIVGAGAVHHHMRIVRQIKRGHLAVQVRPDQRAGNDSAAGTAQLRAYIQDHGGLVVLCPLLQLMGRNTGHAQLPVQALALPPFVRQKQAEANQQHHYPDAPQLFEDQQHIRHRVMKHQADGQPAAGVQDGADRVKENEAAKGHAGSAGQRRGERGKARDELGQDERLGTPAREDRLGLPHAGVG